MNDGMAARLREAAEAAFAGAVAAVWIGETPRSTFVARFEQGTLRRLARRREREREREKGSLSAGPDSAAATLLLLECAARIAERDLLIVQGCVHGVTGAWRALAKILSSCASDRARRGASRPDPRDVVGTLWLRLNTAALRKRLDRTTEELRRAVARLDLDSEWTSRADRTFLAHALYCCLDSVSD